MKKITTTIIIILTSMVISFAQQNNFNGLGVGLDNLYRLSKAKTRSISPENPTGEFTQSLVACSAAMPR